MTPAKKTPAKKAPAKPISLGTCFVLMPFKEPFDAYYRAIFKPAIAKAKLTPVRADDLFRPSVIVSDLWGMIQEAKVLLAELTTKNANVFYELGLAHAIGKPVILVTETMDDVPFDLQQLRILLYNKDDPAWGEILSEGIASSIAEIIANPIEAVPSIFRRLVASQAPEQNETAARLDAMEGQIRGLRLDAKRWERKQEMSVAERKLSRVDSSGELDRWVQEMSKAYPVSYLLSLVRGDKSHLPSNEVSRVEEILLARRDVLT